jgi:serine/threonine protein kinase/formylglycine-generating enzyme required for sulfatase activity
MMHDPALDDSADSAPIDDPVEQAIAAALELPEQKWTAAIESACEEHPEYADRIRRRMKVLQRSGLLLEPREGELLEGIPERLGDFRLIRELGGGGMGVIYLAEQVSKGREVALKLVRPDQLYFPGSRKRFQRELNTIARLKHPGIVPVFAVGESQGIAYLAMEYIHGVTLADVLAELEHETPDRLGGRDLFEAIYQKTRDDAADLPLPEAYQGSWVEACLRVFLQIAEALEHAHQRGVVHRDVKPGNIMLTASGQAQLVDFGLSRSEGASRLTRTGVALGSLPYMAPEQVRGDREVDHRCDVYSLGVTLYELLTLKAPYRSRDAQRLRQQILRGSPPSLRSISRTIPADVQSVCLKAMDRDPGNRYATADELAADLEKALHLRPVAARRGSTVMRTLRMMRRHPVVAAVIALLLVQVFVTQVLILLNFRGQRDEALDALDEARIAQEQTQELRAQAEQTLDETRKMLEVAWLHSLPLEAQEIAIGEDNIPIIDHWLERAKELLDREERLHSDLTEMETLLEGAEDPGERQELRSQVGRLRTTLQQLERVRELYERMTEDREFATTVRYKTVDSPAAQRAWEDAIEDIFLMDIYDGLELVPQPGLLPLDKDPETGLWEFLHLQSGTAPERNQDWDSPNPWEITAETGIVMVLVPGGTFHMGAEVPTRNRPQGWPNVDPYADVREGPVQTLQLDPFFISKFELTQPQWKRLALTHKNPSSIHMSEMGFAPLPVETITWPEARRVLHRAGMELPTEAQWEYACRAGTTSVFFAGAQPDSVMGYTNFGDRPLSESLQRRGKGEDGFAATAPVGSYQANPWGIHDILGNVAEMTREGEGSYQTNRARQGDGLRREPGEDGWLIIRGGSYFSELTRMRSSSRDYFRIDKAMQDTGIRPIIPATAR